MKANFSSSLFAAVMTAALCLQPSVAQAGMISARQVAARNQSVADRLKVQAFLDRADVKRKLQALGVKSLFAQERVAALSDQEVHALAGRIDSLPAGGRLLNSISDNDLIVILLVAILVAAAAA